MAGTGTDAIRVAMIYKPGKLTLSGSATSDTASIHNRPPLLARFAEEWTSHGRTLLASAEFLHRQFLVIGLDESVAGASGCSIDASVRFVRELETRLGVELLEKSRLAFLNDGEVWLLENRNLRAAVADGRVTATTFYFDNALQTKAELDEKWPAPAGQTWLARYFPG